MTSQSPPLRSFQWPAPVSPTDISVKEIIEKYYPHDKELLKHALMAKVEEDKKQTAQDVLKTEMTRIHLRQLDLEVMREQSRLTGVRSGYHPPPSSSTTGYYSLAPVQQQVLARITANQPSSPVVYPHSAHPLCIPDNRLNPPRQYAQHLQLPTSQQQPTTPISPNHDYDFQRKRVRGSITEEEKLSHNKVMEALKAKIQRGSHSPLTTVAPSSAFRPTTIHENNKRQRTLPKPTVIATTTELQPSTPSPRSAKPILPPIDTTIGRIPTTHLPSHPLISPIKSSTPPALTTTTTTTTITTLPARDTFVNSE
ncbi:uncharacterized protein EV154DRAFT_465902 [Mucor mucedo]|uniref:uncharacterized protein n=1 Tax=Mucor mucedo TaxID=29922 RepID=UPI00221FC169|nr:uncharacterized protein EV154DRAFT_465902 [Mucor mucedo]KAI7890218.1 hypothetical protein EV154DRAFT_465902 [Mucor mucedo]